MRITLCQAKRQDAGVLTDMMAEFYREDAMYFSRKKAARAFGILASDPDLGQVWLIEAQGAVVGYVVLAYGFSMEFFGKDAFIDDIFIKKEWRGQGIGKKALKEVIRYAKKKKVLALHLEVDPKKDRASSLYASLGFDVRSRLCLASKKLVS